MRKKTNKVKVIKPNDLLNTPIEALLYDQYKVRFVKYSDLLKSLDNALTIDDIKRIVIKGENNA